MSVYEPIKNLGEEIDEVQQGLQELADILRMRITWDTVFSEISAVEKELYRKITEFMRKQTEYMRVVNILLDSISSDQLKLDFSVYTAMEAKYKVLDHRVTNFKEKLSLATQKVGKERTKWLDEFYLNQFQFLMQSADERHATVERCKEGNRVVVSAKRIMRNLTVQWSAIEVEVEDQLKDCSGRVEDLLEGKLAFTHKWDSRCLSDNKKWRERITKALRKRALCSDRCYNKRSGL